MFIAGLEDLHNIKQKCGKKSMVQVMVTYYTSFWYLTCQGLENIKAVIHSYV